MEPGFFSDRYFRIASAGCPDNFPSVLKPAGKSRFRYERELLQLMGLFRATIQHRFLCASPRSLRFHFRSLRGRFMESSLFLTDLLTGHEPRLLHLTRFRLRLRRVETTLSPARAAEGRFMKSCDIQIRIRLGAMNRPRSTPSHFMRCCQSQIQNPKSTIAIPRNQSRTAVKPRRTMRSMSWG